MEEDGRDFEQAPQQAASNKMKSSARGLLPTRLLLLALVLRWPAECAMVGSAPPESKPEEAGQLVSSSRWNPVEWQPAEPTSTTTEEPPAEEANQTHLVITSTLKPPAAVTARGPGQRLSAEEAPQEAAQNTGELCFLSDGSSSLTLTVNEATPVGAVVGTVEVNGDPSLEGGNVDLFEGAAGFQDQLAGRGQQSGELAGGESAPAPQARSPKSTSRRLLGKRSLESAEQPPSLPADQLISSSESGALEEAEAGAEPKLLRRRPKMFSPAPPARLLAVDEAPASTTGGLYASGSFYSLVAGGSSPQAPPSGAQPQQQVPGKQPPAVRLEPGTKRLVLIRPLDREASESEQSILIQVHCLPRKWSGKSRLEEASSIPVRIVVTDANDQPPEFVGAPYVLNISETAPVGSVVSRDILALDKDSAGPFSTISYRVLEGDSPAHQLLQFANPLDPTLLLAGQLDYETLGPSFTLTLLAADQGEPEQLSSSAQVLVNIIDFDDQNPKFLDDKYTLAMDEAQQNLVGQSLQVLPRNVHAEDGDRGINAPIVYSFDQAARWPAAEDSPEPADNIERYLHLSPGSGEIRLLRHWPSNWSGAPLTLVLRATQADNKDRYTLTTLTITRGPAPGLASGPPALAAKPSASGSRRELDREPLPPGELTGIEFAPDKLLVSVPENTPVNEKIARVRARYLASGGEQQPAGSEQQAQVDLVAESGQQLKPADKPPPGKPAKKLRFAEQANSSHAAKRPIVYQILDDHSEQFAINGLGEIFLKRPLDFELKQEYKFKVLASYTKFSDVCHVQLNVLNVNDNKPKFTQPQYTFHLTESRLRSNVIGSVQAKDLDLNDSLRYSLSGDQAHLFEINPSSGQISLRPNIKQLNVSQCQLLAHATDSLAQPFHSHQARVNLHVAPQLVGRSLNLAAELRLFPAEGRSLSSAPERAGSPYQLERLLPVLGNRSSSAAVAAQRSSVATVMSSLQHMIKQTNFLEMPLSSAILLSALLALLLCLLAILVVSMSVSVYRRRAKLRHRQHLASLRHAHLASLHPGERARYLAGSGLSSVMSLSPAPPPPPPPPPGPPSHSAGSSSSQLGGSSQNSPPSGHYSSAGSDTKMPSANDQLPLTSNLHQLSALTGSRARVIETAPELRSSRPSSAATNRTGSRQSAALASCRSPGNSSSLLSCGSMGARGRPVRPTREQLQRQRLLVIGAEAQPIGSPLSKRSLRSTASTTDDDDDDSSIMHCGHYSVTNTASRRPKPEAASQRARTAGGAVGQAAQSSVEAALESLARELGGEIAGAGAKNLEERHQRRLSNELSALTDSKPDIRAYRKLNSLAWPARAKRANKVAPAEGPRTGSQDSAIASASDSSSTAGRSGSAHPEAPKQACDMTPSGGGRGLLLLSSPPGRRELCLSPRAGSASSPHGYAPWQSPPPGSERLANNIRWPQNLAPNRVKKLTWDDELSISPANADEHYLSSPPASEHQFSQFLASETHEEQQQFLFSNPCSPAPAAERLPAPSSLQEAGRRVAPTGSATSHSLGQPNAADNQPPSSFVAQDNCFDYTIVQADYYNLNRAHQRRQLSPRRTHHHQDLNLMTTAIL